MNDINEAFDDAQPEPTALEHEVRVLRGRVNDQERVLRATVNALTNAGLGSFIPQDVLAWYTESTHRTGA